MGRLVPTDEQVADQIRVNVAFEQMIVAVLAGAFVGGGLTLIMKLGVFLFSAGVSFSGLVGVFLETLLVGFLIFLIGFFSSVAIGAPLFMALEKRKRRNMWPYLAASLAVAILTFIAASGGLPTRNDFSLIAITAIFVPAIVIALIFARLMRPHWRAAERAEAEEETRTAFRLH